MRSVLVIAGATAVFAAAFTAISAAPAGAAVPAHDHWLTTGSDTVVHVGPDVCTNPDLYDAWLNFHLNVHKGVPGSQAFTNPDNPVSIAATPCP